MAAGDDIIPGAAAVTGAVTVALAVDGDAVTVGGQDLIDGRDPLLAAQVADVVQPVEGAPVLACGCLEEQASMDLVEPPQSLLEDAGSVGAQLMADHLSLDQQLSLGAGVTELPVPFGAVAGAAVVGEDATEVSLTAAVNSTTWSKLPVADRDTKFAFRAAINRLAAHATSIEQFSSWFFWRDPSKPANNRNSYRMPFADVFDDGTVKLVPAAVFSAAAQLSGAHGALPIIPPAEKQQIIRTIDRIYDKFRTMWDDPRQVPPWDRAPSPEEPVEASLETEATMAVTLVGNDLTAALGFAPPSAAFANPGFSGPTKPRITDMGGWYAYQGHIAQWGVCHRGFKDTCILAPRSRSNYAEFTTGQVLTADGQLVDTGTITMNTGHAAHGLGLSAAVAHYDNTGLAAVAAAVGEDAFGIWASGVVLPGVDPATVFALRASAISGDWRWDGSNLELCAALAVNTPGFPVYEMTASGAEMMSLTAAGVVHEDDCSCSVTADTGVPIDVGRLADQQRAMDTAVSGRRQRKLLNIELPVRS